MKILKFNITGQTIEKDDSTDWSNIVRGSKGYLQASFSFDDSWDGYTKAAEFAVGKHSYYVPVIKGVCDVPDGVTDNRSFWVRVYGKVDGVMTHTDKVEVKQT